MAVAGWGAALGFHRAEGTREQSNAYMCGLLYIYIHTHREITIYRNVYIYSYIHPQQSTQLYIQMYEWMAVCIYVYNYIYVHMHREIMIHPWTLRGLIITAFILVRK